MPDLSRPFGTSTTELVCMPVTQECLQRLDSSAPPGCRNPRVGPGPRRLFSRPNLHGVVLEGQLVWKGGNDDPHASTG